MIIQIGRAFADSQRLRARVVGEHAQITGAPEFLAVAAIMRHYRLRAEANLMTAEDGRHGVISFVLPIDQQGRLRRARCERSARRDGHRVLRAVDYRTELGDGVGQLKLHTDIIDEAGRKDRCLAHLRRVTALMEDTRHAGQAIAAHDAIGIGVEEGVQIATEEQVVPVIELTVEAKESQPAVVVSHINARLDGRDHRRTLVFPAELAGHKEVSGAARSDGPAEVQIGLPQSIAEQRVAGRVGGDMRKSRESSGGVCRPPRFRGFPMQLASPAAADDVDDAAGAATVFGGESIGQHVHLLHGLARQRGDEGLAAPGIDGVGAIRLEPRLPAPGPVGGEQRLIHKNVALADGWAIGGAQHREVGDFVAEQRSGVHLDGVEQRAQLRLIGPHLANHARDGDLAPASGHVELQFQIGGGVAGERHSVERGVGEARFGRGDGVRASDRKSRQREVAAGVAFGDALQAGLRVGRGQCHAGNSRVALVDNAAMNGSGVGRLGEQNGGGGKKRREKSEYLGHKPSWEVVQASNSRRVLPRIVACDTLEPWICFRARCESRFRPGGLSGFLALNAAELNDAVVDLANFRGPLAPQGWPQLAEATPENRVRLLQEMLRARANGQIQIDPLLQHCAIEIRAARNPRHRAGCLTILGEAPVRPLLPSVAAR